MCKQFGCLPSALLAEDSEMIRMLRLIDDDQEEE